VLAVGAIRCHGACFPWGNRLHAAGAELQALVRHATNWALDENLNHSNLKDIPKDFHPIVSRQHFMTVLETSVKPAFGAPEETLTTYHKEGIFAFGPRFDKLLRDISAAAKLTATVPKATILLQGTTRDPNAFLPCMCTACCGAACECHNIYASHPHAHAACPRCKWSPLAAPSMRFEVSRRATHGACACAAGAAGTGKTALATYVSKRLGFPFVKLVDFFSIMGKTEPAAADVLKKAFDDAAKSPLSALILDDVAKLLQYAKHGPRYSLLLLHTLQTLLKQRPPDGKRMVIIATADTSVTRALDLRDSFTNVVRVAPLTRDEAAAAMKSSGMVRDPEILRSAVGMMPPADLFGASIRALTSGLLRSSPGGALDLSLWEQWAPTFEMSSMEDQLNDFNLN
jgi:ATPase family associated with various cellular activities (AAA)